MLNPRQVISALKQNIGKVIVGKVDVDQEPELAREYGVMSIPTLIIFRDGAEVGRLVGALPKEKLVEEIKRTI